MRVVSELLIRRLYTVMGRRYVAYDSTLKSARESYLAVDFQDALTQFKLESEKMRWDWRGLVIFTAPSGEKWHWETGGKLTWAKQPFPGELGLSDENKALLEQLLRPQKSA